MAKPKPLIIAGPVSEFGEIDPFTEGGDPSEAPGDFTTVPGWSDLKFARDLALAEVAQGARAAKDVPSLPVNVRWTRRMSAGGNFDGLKLMTTRNNGYDPVKESDIGKPWFTALPPGATVAADGSILNAAKDCQLMVATQHVAARNLQKKNKRFLESVGMAGEVVQGVGEGLMQAGNAIAGASPTIERSTS